MWKNMHKLEEGQKDLMEKKMQRWHRERTQEGGLDEPGKVSITFDTLY